MKETANGTACGKMTVNDVEYTVLKLLGKGKGGYSYLVTDGTTQYVLKQIHHEPCEYYAFGDKLQAELADTMAMCGAHCLADIKRSMLFGY